MTSAQRNDVIQIIEEGAWKGALLQVEEVKSWGVKAYLIMPTQGTVYSRIEHGKYEVIGPAAWMQVEEE
ncbi:MAG: hypothetical protein ACYCQJ_13120 [Nitrososphaerales archaeon]